MSSTLWIIWERYCYLFVQLECERTVSWFCSVLLIFASNRVVGSPLHRYVFFLCSFLLYHKLIFESSTSALADDWVCCVETWNVHEKFEWLQYDPDTTACIMITTKKKKDTAECIKVACIKKWATSIYSFIFLSNCIFFGELFSQLE